MYPARQHPLHIELSKHIESVAAVVNDACDNSFHAFEGCVYRLFPELLCNVVLAFDTMCLATICTVAKAGSSLTNL